MSVADTIIERLRAYRRYRRTVSELSSLSDAQLEDIGITRWEIDKRARLTAGTWDRGTYRPLIAGASIRYSGA